MSYRQEPLPKGRPKFPIPSEIWTSINRPAAPYFNSTYAFVCQFWSVAFEMNYISYFKQAAIVHILLEKGADINAQGGDYGNALHAASERGHLDTVQILLEKGANINA